MRRRGMKLTSGILAGALALGMLTVPQIPVQAATEHWNDGSASSVEWAAWKANWETYLSDYEKVSLTPGVDQTQLNLAWYSHTAEMPKVRISTTQEMTNAVEFTGTQTAITAELIGESAITNNGLEGYYSNKVTVKDLKENTKYYYQVWKNGAWSEAEEYNVKSFTDYSFIYVGDPQIGACKGQTSAEGESMADKADLSSTLAARNDAYNWNNVLNNAVATHDVSFIVSAGDQVNSGDYEYEYAGYLGADALASYPVATTIGNHDSGSYQYSLHYNNPNAFDKADETYTKGATKAGTDYYYTYGNMLFIVLDTNNYNCATHKNVIDKAVKKNPDVTWRVVMFHQDIYGSGNDHSDSDGMVLRTQLTPIMDEYDIDVVLQGHDHTYSRTYQLTSDGTQHTAYDNTNWRNVETGEYLSQNNCYDIKSDTVSGTVVNPEGTVYLEANSATGSKFYELIPTQQDFISERSQTWRPSYAVIDVTENTFSMTTYDAETGAIMEGASTYTIKKADVQTITATENYNKTMGDAAFELDAKAEGTLNYESDNEDVAVVSKTGKVRLTGEGTAHIKVTAAETEKCQAAEKTITINVAKKAVSNQATTPESSAEITAPKKMNLKSVTSSKTGKVKITWKKNSEADGYVIMCANNKKFTKNLSLITVKKNSTVTKTIKWASKQNCYVKICAYKNIDGGKLYSSYSKAKNVKTK